MNQFISQFACQKVRNLLYLQKQSVVQNLSQNHLGSFESSQAYQIALYSDLSEQQKCVKFLGYDYSYGLIYGVYGCLMDEQSLPKLLLYLVKIFEQEILQKQETIKGISIIFFNKGYMGRRIFNQIKYKPPQRSINFMDFKNLIIKKLNFKCLFLIRKIYFCHPSFICKSIHCLPTFGLLNLIIDELIQHIDSLYILTMSLGPLFYSSLIDQRVQLIQKSLDWNFTFSEDDRTQAKRKMFRMGQIDKQRPNIYKYDLQQYVKQFNIKDLTNQNVPKLLISLFEVIGTNYKSSQGIFRKACDEQDLEQMERQMVEAQKKKKKINQLLETYDPQTLSSCVKKIFTILRKPFFSQEIYLELLEMASQNNCKKLSLTLCEYQKVPSEMMSTINNHTVSLFGDENPERREHIICKIRSIFHNKLLPIALATLSQTIRFLTKVILPDQRQNKMSPYNLAVVFTPCLFRPKQYCFEDLLNSQKMTKFIEFLLINYEEIIRKQN